MWDIYRESIAFYNLPLTAFLGVCLLYWLLVSLGALHFPTHGHIHLNHGGLHGHGGGQLQGHSGLHGHSTHTLPGKAHAHGGHSGKNGLGKDFHGNPLAVLFRFMNGEDVPLMVVLSFLFLFMWMFALPINDHFNPGTVGNRSGLMALGLAVPNFFISAVLTRLLTQPFKKIMRSLSRNEDREMPIVGRAGKVKTSELTSEFGRIEVLTKGSPLILQARVRDGSISRGSEVLIYEHDPEQGLYWVRPLQQN